MSEEKQSPPAPEPQDEDKRIVRRLQGEDGYDIFADRRPAEDRNAWLREYEENRR
jgi:hypothetical protein